ncbi:MAG TPA: NYN domain-containing protein [Planctomycetota bacterium]|jgi:predicted RNA-binding protein with PIN domain
MRYIIDACNLIFRDRRLEDALENHGFPAARQLLVTMLTRFAYAERTQQIIAVFDGSEKAAHRPRRQRESAGAVELVYADPRSDADRFIIEMVENAQRPGELTVVSSDKMIIRNVRRLQAHTLGCRDFLRRTRRAIAQASDPLQGEDPRKYVGQLSAREVEEWMKIFGFKENE